METKFITILNDYKLPESLPINLGNWELDRPKENEFEHARNLIRTYTASSPTITIPFQEKKEIVDEDGLKTYKTLLKFEEFRYLVLRPLNLKLNFRKIFQAGRLASSDAWIDIIAGKYGNTLYQTQQLSGFVNSKHNFYEFTDLNVKDLQETIKLREQFDDSKFPAIINAVEMFMAQESIDNVHFLKHLGYFSILESILSHKPSSNDSADSITKQLSRNLILINNRMNIESNLLLDEFKELTPKKVISKLYDYRSNIAHGNNKDVKSIALLHKNKPQKLNFENPRINANPFWIGSYLRYITK